MIVNRRRGQSGEHRWHDHGDARTLATPLRLPPNSKVCSRDSHSSLVFFHFPRLSDLSHDLSLFPVSRTSQTMT
jgi:hypothetical protein